MCISQPMLTNEGGGVLVLRELPHLPALPELLLENGLASLLQSCTPGRRGRDSRIAGQPDSRTAGQPDSRTAGHGSRAYIRPILSRVQSQTRDFWAWLLENPARVGTTADQNQGVRGATRPETTIKMLRGETSCAKPGVRTAPPAPSPASRCARPRANLCDPMPVRPPPL